MPVEKDYTYIHCGNCGSIMRDFSGSSEIAGDYTPVDAREIDKMIDIIHTDMLQVAFDLRALSELVIADSTARAHVYNAGQALIRIEDALRYVFAYGDELDGEEDKVVPDSRLPEDEDAEWSRREDTEEPALLLSPGHAATAYDYLSDHLKMYLTGGRHYQPRSQQHEAEERAMRVVLQALDRDRYEAERQGRLAATGRERAWDWFYRSADAEDAFYDFLAGTPPPDNVSLYAFGVIEEMVPGDAMKRGADMLAEIADLSSQGKKVRVYVVEEK